MHNAESLLLVMKKRFTKDEMRLHLLLVHIYTNEVIANYSNKQNIA
jgi:hypothetical protein